MSDTVKIGILNDMSAGPPGPADIHHWLELVVTEMTDAGNLAHQIEFIDAWGLGLPQGSEEAVVRAYEQLDAAGVLLIVGPATGDNALCVTPLADQRRIATLNWAGSEYARSEYMFQLQVGSHQEEPVLLVDYLSEQGIDAVSVIYDQSPIGLGYLDMFRQATARRRIAITACLSVPPLATVVDGVVAQCLARQPQACIYLGLGHAVAPVATALARADWNGEKLMTSAGIRGYAPAFAATIDGWIYVDLFSSCNSTLSALRRRYSIPEHKSLAAAKGYDLGRLLVNAVINAPELTREGVKQGLEQIKWLPAAQGREGTLLSFGKQDHAALHGTYLILRRWQQGRSVEV